MHVKTDVLEKNKPFEMLIISMAYFHGYFGSLKQVISIQFASHAQSSIVSVFVRF